MNYLEPVCQAVVAAVFAWSAIAKLRSRPAFAAFTESLRPFGPRPTPTGIALVAVECVVPPLVLFTPAVGFGVALVLLSVLTGGVTLVVRRGLNVQCRCFGGLRERPIGVRHVLRNLALFSVSVVGFGVATGGRLGVTAMVVGGCVVMGLTAYPILGRLARAAPTAGTSVVRRAMREVGEPVAEFEDQVTTTGEILTRASLKGSRIGIFAPGCEMCHWQRPQFFERVDGLDPERVVVVVIDNGHAEPDDNTAVIVRQFEGRARIVVEPPFESLQTALGTSMWPAMGLIDGQGRILARATRVEDLPEL